jgi:competence protein ComEA
MVYSFLRRVYNESMNDSSGAGIFGRYKKFLLPGVLGVAGLLFLGYGLLSVWQPKKDEPDILFEAASTKAGKTGDTAHGTENTGGGKGREIAVDVEGAVQHPGVYRIDSQSRVEDALSAAGGYSAEADRQRISKTLNLASRVTDGAKVYIPAVGETAVAGAETAGGDQSGIVSINGASQSEIEALPGIGAVTAGKLIQGRPYTSLEELMSKKVVGKKVFEQIKDKISL